MAHTGQSRGRQSSSTQTEDGYWRDDPAGPEDGPWRAAYLPSQARSRSGAVAVTTTSQGLPVSVRIDSSQMQKDPGVLADEILRLCRQSAMAAGVRLREDLLATGTSREVVDGLGLPTADDLATVELRDDADADDTTSWLRRG